MKTLLFCLTLSFTFFAQAIPYQQMPALQKRLVLWSNIQTTAYQQLPDVHNGLSISQILGTLSTMSDLATTFDRTSDQLPTSRQKVIHPFGSVAAIRWVPTANTYTGIYQTGAYGLARLSLAGDPNFLGITPGMAIKLLVDGRPSVNLQVMYSLDGQGTNQNFFAHPFTNDIPGPSSLLLKPLAVLFSFVQDPPTYLAVDHLSRVDRLGRTSRSGVSPYALIFVPSDQVKNRFSSRGNHDFRMDLATLPPGTVIYNVFARANSDSRQATPIGKIVLEGRFVASEYGDQQLFFQHHRSN